MGSLDRGCFLTHLECGLEGDRYRLGRRYGLSKAGRPLVARYDLEKLRSTLDRDALKEREADLWRYRELLPYGDASRVVSLGEARTPLVEVTTAPGHDGRLLVKDEARLPTGSFKARGLCMAVTMARELGVKEIAMPTNGNAGAALAAYATRAGIRSHVYCPADTLEINVRETAAQGANVTLVDGLIDDCGKIVGEGVRKHGWFDFSTLKEPFRLEGKKTMGLELADQCGWRLPEVIFYPTGGGTGLIGMWKAFAELRELGWLETDQMPRMVAVQSDRCAPIVRAFDRGEEFAARWADAEATVAAGIRVPAAVGDFMILSALRESDGFAMAVDEKEILSSREVVAKRDGFLMCPEGAATHAAYLRAVREGLVQDGDAAVLFNCATAYKYDLPPLP